MFIDSTTQENLEAPEKRNISTDKKHSAPAELKRLVTSKL
jgi:hypothetical protein